MQIELNNLRTRHSLLKGKMLERQRILEQTTIELNELNKRHDLYLKTSSFLKECADTIRREIEESIEQVVTSALQAILGPQYRFEIEYLTTKNSVSAQFLISTPFGKDDFLLSDPLTANGGSICDILSFALRIAILELYTPKIEGPIIFDESGRFISKEYRLNTSEFLLRISEDTNRQIIFITHEPDFMENAHRIFKVTKGDDNVSSAAISEAAEYIGA